MASKGPRSKLDHEPRPKRQKALETENEPCRPKAHWDNVLEEMIWLSKDFESERKWKLAQAKKVALRTSKGMLDQATRGERKLKEEQRLKKIALNISKDVKKLLLKIEKLVLCKHQMELDEKKKKALDKQLELVLRCSTMLAEILGDSYKPIQQYRTQDQPSIQFKEMDKNDTKKSTELNAKPDTERADIDVDDDAYDVESEDRTEDDENTIEEDEALLTEQKREEELAVLQNEVNLPLEELLKQYPMEKDGLSVSPEGSTEKGEDATEMTSGDDHGICPEKDKGGAEMTSVEEEHDMSPGKNGDGAELILLGKKDDMSPGKDEDGKELTSVEEERVKQDEDGTKMASVGEEQVMCSEKVEDAAEITSVGEEPGEKSDLFVSDITEKINSDVATGRRRVCCAK